MLARTAVCSPRSVKRPSVYGKPPLCKASGLRSHHLQRSPCRWGVSWRASYIRETLGLVIVFFLRCQYHIDITQNIWNSSEPFPECPLAPLLPDLISLLPTTLWPTSVLPSCFTFAYIKKSAINTVPRIQLASTYERNQATDSRGYWND